MKHIADSAVWMMIGTIVVLATAGDVALAGAMRRIGDLDEIRAHSGLLGAIRAVLTNAAIFLWRTLHGAQFFLAALCAELGRCQPGRARLRCAHLCDQRLCGQMDFERKC